MTQEIAITPLQRDYLQIAEKHLKLRASDNPEFQKLFIKTFSDMLFSQTDEMLEKLSKVREQSLVNAVFRATELGASFAKKEISVLPFEITVKENRDGVMVERKTGTYELTLITDINYQKQIILRMPNCKKFFTAEVHEGVEVIENLSTGNYDFIGVNSPSKPTIGYYASFLSTDNVLYDIFMSNSTIIDRAKMNPHYKSKLYENPSSNVHFEKIVVRNLMKIIPKTTQEAKSILITDQAFDYAEFVEVDESPKVNALEDAKKQIAQGVEPITAEQPTQESAPTTEESQPKPNIKAF